MSKKPPVVKIGRIIIRTPDEIAAESARATKALNARNKAANYAPLRRRAPNYSTAQHNPAQPLRPGAEEALAFPSRIGDRLHHRDGRVTPFPSTQSKA